MILSCQNISKSFGEDLLFSDVSFQMEAGDKYAIVGPNGCGKSTLLKMIVGQIPIEEGLVTFAKETTFGYLAQYQEDTQDRPILDIVLEASVSLIEQEYHLRQMEEQMAVRQGEELEKILEDYHRFSEQFERQGGLTFRSQAIGILKGLGFAQEDLSKQASQLSGGQLTRVYLARLLQASPDLLILDEPINHLDLASIQWLENFLKGYQGGVILVAHDRYFLNRIVDHVLDLSHHQGHVFAGDYSSYVAQKHIMQETLQKEYENQQKFIAHQEAVIAKLKQFNREKSIRRAESRQKTLDKLERSQAPLEENHRMRLSLEPAKESGKDVLTIEGMSMGFGEQLLFSGLDLLLQRGERLAILGDNGTGKTTLLKILNEKLLPLSGHFRLGANVQIGYYDQAQQELSDEKTLFEELSDAYPKLSNTRIRNVLAAFLFVGDDVYKHISSLSGGERGRVALAKLMLSGANFLILDEPTNHLDMESKDILEEAIRSYSGTLLFVSHDRYFINRVATRILALEEKQFHPYLGNYDYYLQKRDEEMARSRSLLQATSESSDAQIKTLVDQGKMDWNQQKKQAAALRKLANEKAKLEEEIAAKEERIQEIMTSFETTEVATNSAKLNALSQEQRELQEEVDELYEAWASLEDM